MFYKPGSHRKMDLSVTLSKLLFLRDLSAGFPPLARMVKITLHHIVFSMPYAPTLRV